MHQIIILFVITNGINNKGDIMNPYTTPYTRITFGNSKTGPGIFVKDTMNNNFSFYNTDCIYTNCVNDNYSKIGYPGGILLNKTINNYNILHLHAKVNLVTMKNSNYTRLPFLVYNSNNIKLHLYFNYYPSGKCIRYGINGVSSWTDFFIFIISYEH